jgi:hypothetical protein
MGTKVYNKLPGYIKETDNYKAFKKELKMFLLLHSFYSIEESVFCNSKYFMFFLTPKDTIYFKYIVPFKLLG